MVILKNKFFLWLMSVKIKNKTYGKISLKKLSLK